MPTLEEALRLTKDKSWYVNVEIKDHARLVGHETVTKDVLDLIRRLDMTQQVIISSFQHRYLEECRALCPDMATGALVEHLRPADPVGLCRRLGVNAYHPDRNILAPGDSGCPARCGLRRQRLDGQRHGRSPAPRLGRRERHHHRFSRRLPQSPRLGGEKPCPGASDKRLSLFSAFPPLKRGGTALSRRHAVPAGVPGTGPGEVTTGRPPRPPLQENTCVHSV